VGNVTGSWSSFGPFDGIVTGRLFTSYINHGAPLVAPASYAYAVVPNVSAAAMPAIVAGNAGAACVYNTPTVMGVADPAVRVTQAVFWAEAGGAYGCADAASGYGMNVTANLAALVVVTETGADGAGGSVAVTISNPVTPSATVAITVSRQAAGPGCSPGAQPGTTVFNVTLPSNPNYLGASVTVACTRTA
jgi:hypothetical protein